MIFKTFKKSKADDFAVLLTSLANSMSPGPEKCLSKSKHDASYQGQ